MKGLEGDACQAPHWGYMLGGIVVATYTNGTEETCSGNDLFYWPPGHSVRVVDDAEVILFSPQVEHSRVMDQHARADGERLTDCGRARGNSVFRPMLYERYRGLEALLRLHCEQQRRSGHPLEMVFAAVVESDSGSSGEISYGRRREDIAGPGD